MRFFMRASHCGTLSPPASISRARCGGTVGLAFVDIVVLCVRVSLSRFKSAGEGKRVARAS